MSTTNSDSATAKQSSDLLLKATLVGDSLIEETASPRFIVGIDLGTTNCAVAFVDTELSRPMVQVFEIEQLVDWGTVEKRKTLPSFHYQLTELEVNSHSIPSASTKWISNRGRKDAFCVGILARERGIAMPGRQVMSAKSWLCHSGADRTAPILPWHGDEDVESISPVTASSRYLEHIRNAWDSANPHHPLSQCEVVITLPASFDEVARELTIQAAKLAGLPKIILIEEPQSAFYAWLAEHSDDWQEKISAGQSILICDIGGGTTDLTLIRVKKRDDSEELALHRVAVGEHLILGGDNLDLALAKAIEPMLLAEGQKQLSTRAWESLRLQSRVAKETLLSDSAPNLYAMSIAGSSSRIIANIQSVNVDRQLVEKTLLDGFFPFVELTERAEKSKEGFYEFGLPYAADPSITKHLAQFLWDHRWDGQATSTGPIELDLLAARPDWILFNGGVLESSKIKNRIVEQINRWFADTTGKSLELQDTAKQNGLNNISNEPWQIGILEAKKLDLAVAIGAAYFGLVKRGQGVKIDARLARAYYLQIDNSPPRALCIMPGDASSLETHRFDAQPFQLEVGRPVQFPIWYSSTHLVHRAGEIVEIDFERMVQLPPIQTVIQSSQYKRQQKLPVVIESQLTEIGTLDLSLASQNTHWKLAFDLRSTTETDRQAHTGLLERSGIVDLELSNKAADLIEAAFAKNASVQLAKNLAKELVRELGIGRSEWTPSLLRSMWMTLIECDEGRRQNADMESRWLNLIGFTLRPGFGFAADDWRVATTWRKIQGKLQYPSSISDAIVTWRRIAGGFTAGQQRALYQDLQSRIQTALRGEQKGMNQQEAVELLRLAGSLELLPISDKIALAKRAIDSVRKSSSSGAGRGKPVKTGNTTSALTDAMLWMLGRIGSRVPMYGPMNTVIGPDIVGDWTERLVQGEGTAQRMLAVMLLSRRTGDRYRDISAPLRSEVTRKMNQWNAPESYLKLIEQGGELSSEQRDSVYGEALPLGLQLS